MKFVEYAYLIFVISQVILVVSVVRSRIKLQNKKKLYDEK
jgi:hypothetical protein